MCIALFMFLITFGYNFLKVTYALEGNFTVTVLNQADRSPISDALVLVSSRNLSSFPEFEFDPTIGGRTNDDGQFIIIGEGSFFRTVIWYFFLPLGVTDIMVGKSGFQATPVRTIVLTSLAAREETFFLATPPPRPPRLNRPPRRRRPFGR